MMLSSRMQPLHEGGTGPPRALFEALLTAPAFLFAIALLVLNDWLLKPALGNWFTGKLSDFAGLFALAWLLTALFPERRKSAFAATGLGFLLWKSSLMNAPLAAWNSLGWWQLTRVVDYTDWIALVALVASYWMVERRLAASSCESISDGTTRRRLFAIASGAFAVLSFAADTVIVPPPQYPLPDITAYTIAGTRGDVTSGLVGLGLVSRDSTARSMPDSAPDTLSVYIRQPPERTVAVIIEVREVSSTEVTLKLLTVRAFGPAPSTAAIDQAFDKQVIEPLQDWLAKHRHGER